MRNALVALLLAAGCGSSNPQFTDDAGNILDLSGLAGADLAHMQSMPDLAQPSDLAGAFVCGTDGVCMGGNVCCVTAVAGGGATGSCQATCGDGGVPVQCRGPENCSGNPCCVTIMNNVPTTVSCTNDPNACMPMFSFSGSMIQSAQTRLCHVDSDCGGGTYNSCCTATMNGVKQQFCFNAFAAVGSMGAVTCP